MAIRRRARAVDGSVERLICSAPLSLRVHQRVNRPVRIVQASTHQAVAYSVHNTLLVVVATMLLVLLTISMTLAATSWHSKRQQAARAERRRGHPG